MQYDGPSRYAAILATTVALVTCSTPQDGRTFDLTAASHEFSDAIASVQSTSTPALAIVDSFFAEAFLYLQLPGGTVTYVSTAATADQQTTENPAKSLALIATQPTASVVSTAAYSSQRTITQKTSAPLISSGDVSGGALNAKLSVLAATLSARVDQLAAQWSASLILSVPAQTMPVTTASFSPTQRIDTVSNMIITAPAITGGSIRNTTRSNASIGSDNRAFRTITAGIFTGTNETLGTLSAARNFVPSDTSSCSRSATFSALLKPNGATVTLPSGSCYNLDQDVNVTNKNLVVDGCTFTGPGRIILSGTASLSGSGTLSNGNGANGAVLIQDSGSYSIQGLSFQNVTATAGILVEPLAGATISSLTITGNTFANSNYGILRIGGAGEIGSTTITNNVIHNMQGDAIELNVVPNDRNIIIANNNISQINNTNSNPYWGIGIGVAGANYSDAFPDGQVAQDFVIEGNIISGARQGIHVEAAKNFTIQNNTLSEISNLYSPNSGLETAGIVTYGTAQFTIDNNTIYRQDNGRGIFINPGAVSGQYVGLPTNFTVNGNTMNDLSTLSGFDWSTTGTVNITNNTGGSMNVTGGPSGMTVANNVWTSPFD